MAVGLLWSLLSEVLGVLVVLESMWGGDQPRGQDVATIVGMMAIGLGIARQEIGRINAIDVGSEVTSKEIVTAAQVGAIEVHPDLAHGLLWQFDDEVGVAATADHQGKNVVFLLVPSRSAAR